MEELQTTTDNSQTPRVVQFLGYDLDSGAQELRLYVELMSTTNMMELLGMRALNAFEVQKFASQLASGLQWFHSHGIYHRDLTPANILLSEDGLKIADLGLALEVVLESVPMPHTPLVSTPPSITS